MDDIAEAAAWIRSWPHRWQEESGVDWAVTATRRWPDGSGSNDSACERASANWLAYWMMPAARGHHVAGEHAGFGSGRRGTGPALASRSRQLAESARLGDAHAAHVLGRPEFGAGIAKASGVEHAVDEVDVDLADQRGVGPREGVERAVGQG